MTTTQGQSWIACEFICFKKEEPIVEEKLLILFQENFDKKESRINRNIRQNPRNKDWGMCVRASLYLNDSIVLWT